MGLTGLKKKKGVEGTRRIGLMTQVMGLTGANHFLSQEAKRRRRTFSGHKYFTTLLVRSKASCRFSKRTVGICGDCHPIISFLYSVDDTARISPNQKTVVERFGGIYATHMNQQGLDKS
jgi:hypothetical protein